MLQSCACVAIELLFNFYVILPIHDKQLIMCSRAIMHDIVEPHLSEPLVPYNIYTLVKKLIAL